MDYAQRTQIRQWIKETFITLGEPNLYGSLEVEFSNRFTARMGDASLNRLTRKTKVRFSVPLWAHATDTQRHETVVHEVCHIVDMLRGGYKIHGAHGASWQALMLKCGILPERCHSVQRPAELERQMTRYSAKCNCRTYMITSQKRTKILSGRVQFRCSFCMAIITL